MAEYRVRQVSTELGRQPGFHAGWFFLGFLLDWRLVHVLGRRLALHNLFHGRYLGFHAGWFFPGFFHDWRLVRFLGRRLGFFLDLYRFLPGWRLVRFLGKRFDLYGFFLGFHVHGFNIGVVAHVLFVRLWERFDECRVVELFHEFFDKLFNQFLKQLFVQSFKQSFGKLFK